MIQTTTVKMMMALHLSIETADMILTAEVCGHEQWRFIRTENKFILDSNLTI